MLHALVGRHVSARGRSVFATLMLDDDRRYSQAAQIEGSHQMVSFRAILKPRRDAFRLACG
jgi:hypothetical protein